MKQKVIATIVALIVIVGGLYWYVSNNKAMAPEVNSNTAENTSSSDKPLTGDVPGDAPDTNPTVPTTDTIAVSTQIPGSSVTIDNVFLSKPGFVVIHEATANGKPGEIIGSSGLLGVGAKQDLEINATIKPGAKYYAMVHMDNGDKKFTAALDLPVTKDGGPVMTMFSVTQ